jgi:heme oxygenase (staphylobilin-producing)
VYLVINRLKAPAEYAPRLEQGFAHTSGGLQGLPGFVAFQFWRRDEGGEYLAVTTWQDKAAYENYLNSEQFQRAHGGANPNSPVQSSLESYDVLIAEQAGKQ